MKPESKILFFLTTLAFTTALAGCSKSRDTSAQALDPARIPAAVNQAFDKAPEETKQEATSYVAALQGQDAPTAFAQLRKLSTEHNLSAEQRTVIAKAMQTTFQQLQAAAQNGNAAAKSALHQYLSTR